MFFDLPKFEYRVDSFAVQNTPLPEYRKKSENCHISAFQNTRFLHWNEYMRVNDVERLLELDEEIFATLVVFVRFEELIPSQVDLAAPL